MFQHLGDAMAVGGKLIQENEQLKAQLAAATDLPTQLKIAFAEMRLADDKGAANASDIMAWNLYEEVAVLSARLGNGESSPELLAEMRRVTAGLEGNVNG